MKARSTLFVLVAMLALSSRAAPPPRPRTTASRRFTPREWAWRLQQFPDMLEDDESQPLSAACRPGRRRQPGRAPGLLQRRPRRSRCAAPRPAFRGQPRRPRRLPQRDRGRCRRPEVPRLRGAAQFRQHLLDRSRLRRPADVPRSRPTTTATSPNSAKFRATSPSRSPTCAPARRAASPRRRSRFWATTPPSSPSSTPQRRGQSLLRAIQDAAGLHAASRAGAAAGRRGRRDHRGGRPGPPPAARLLARRLHPARPRHPRGRGAARRQGLLPGQDPRVRHPRSDSRAHPRARTSRGRPHPWRDGRDHEGGGLHR